ncbi:RteC protein [Algoriella xinjiangensis]|uniref:RteC domain-containing protein n=1 Tax=Algoriella xinjiangensis TaxID=684065 RepID=UPI000F6425E4|nr:RteC domain-containing protein [Algoriella xinjiangensis]VDH16598.1 RteC protein [Algoriella xinjiangensis]
MKQSFYHNVLELIQNEEKNVDLLTHNAIEDSYRMITFLQQLLTELRGSLVKNEFIDDEDEIYFFKKIKPQILGKLIYYNKVYRIETTCPFHNGKMYFNYFSKQLTNLKREFMEHICSSDFYRYYRSGRDDRDTIFFKRGNINYHDGLNSIVFEIDPEFSTFYDYKVVRVLANELLYSYLLTKINPEEDIDHLISNSENTQKDLAWTDSKNALIELVYALYASGTISHGKISIRKISLVFQILFKIPIEDIHHSFHRMKTRSGSRTLFLDYLKLSLEEYMDQDIK